MRLIYKNIRKFLDFRKKFWINGENLRCPQNFFYVTKNNGMSGKKYLTPKMVH